MNAHFQHDVLLIEFRIVFVLQCSIVLSEGFLVACMSCILYLMLS